MYRLKNRKVQAQFTVCHKMFGPGRTLGSEQLSMDGEVTDQILGGRR